MAFRAEGVIEKTGRVSSRWRGFIFDLDGTLIDSMPLHAEAWLEVLPKFGLWIDPKRLLEIGGTPAPQIVRLLAAEQNIEIDPDAVSKAKAEAYLKRVHRLALVRPVCQLVERWAGRLPMAIATGSNRHVARQVLTLTGLSRYFQLIVTYEDVARPKPAPDLYLEAARRIGVSPQYCLGFEDTPVGIAGLRAAGIQAVYVPAFLAQWRKIRRDIADPTPSPLSAQLSAWAEAAASYLVNEARSSAKVSSATVHKS